MYCRGQANKVPDLVEVNSDQISNIAPGCRGVKGLWSPHTGIVDYELVTQAYAEDFKKSGGKIYFNFAVEEFKEDEINDSAYPIVVKARSSTISNNEIRTKYVLTCGGLHSDKLAELTSGSTAPRIIPFRGEYLLLSKDKSPMIQTNVYPVPNSKLPFLGVHFTPRMDGSVWVGPNAVLALKREGYSWFDLSFRDLFECLCYPGFIRVAAKYWIFGLQEIFRSSHVRFQIGHVQKFYPEITVEDLGPGPAGVRAQAVDEDGTLVDDFVFEYGKGSREFLKRVLHCRNAPSPGATSSLAIAKMISDKVDQEFKI